MQKTSISNQSFKTILGVISFFQICASLWPLLISDMRIKIIVELPPTRTTSLSSHRQQSSLFTLQRTSSNPFWIELLFPLGLASCPAFPFALPSLGLADDLGFRPLLEEDDSCPSAPSCSRRSLKCWRISDVIALAEQDDNV